MSLLLLWAWPHNSLAIPAQELDSIIDEWEELYGIKPDRPATTLEQLEDFHEEVSEDIEDLASRVDSFFVNENVIYGRNTTHIRLLNSLTWIETQGAKGDVDVRLRLQLPRLKDKVQFEIDRQVDEYSLDRNREGGSSSVTAINRNTIASDRTRAGFSFFQDIFRWQTKLTGGLEWHNAPDPYGNLRISKNFRLTHRQNFQLIANFFASAVDKTRQLTSLYYDVSLSPKVLFRVLNESNYRDLEHRFETQHALILFDEMNDRNTMSYIYGVRGLNEFGDSSFFLSEAFLSTTLRHRLYKRYLFLETSPGLSWAKLNNFRAEWQFILRLEVIFGKI